MNPKIYLICLAAAMLILTGVSYYFHRKSK